MSFILQLSIFLAAVIIIFSVYELVFSIGSSITKKAVLSVFIVVALSSIMYNLSEMVAINSEISKVEELLDI